MGGASLEVRGEGGRGGEQARVVLCVWGGATSETIFEVFPAARFPLYASRYLLSSVVTGSQVRSVPKSEVCCCLMPVGVSREDFTTNTSDIPIEFLGSLHVLNIRVNEPPLEF